MEAPGASPATGASWPDRRKGWASPGRGPVLPISRMGCVDPIPGELTSRLVLTRRWGRGLFCFWQEATATRATMPPESRTVLLKKKVFLDTCSHVPSPAPGQSTPNRPTALAGPKSLVGVPGSEMRCQSRESARRSRRRAMYSDLALYLATWGCDPSGQGNG